MLIGWCTWMEKSFNVLPSQKRVEDSSFHCANRFKCAATERLWRGCWLEPSDLTPGRLVLCLSERSNQKVELTVVRHPHFSAQSCRSFPDRSLLLICAYVCGLSSNYEIQKKLNLVLIWFTVRACCCGQCELDVLPWTSRAFKQGKLIVN